jgi:hypothetical protein
MVSYVCIRIIGMIWNVEGEGKKLSLQELMKLNVME